MNPPSRYYIIEADSTAMLADEVNYAMDLNLAVPFGGPFAGLNRRWCQAMISTNESKKVN